MVKLLNAKTGETFEGTKEECEAKRMSGATVQSPFNVYKGPWDYVNAD